MKAFGTEFSNEFVVAKYADGEWSRPEIVPLEPRVFALLLYLIEQRHRAVDKDEIQDTVWAGMIVSETALARAIMKARRAVGDSADTQAVIRTVHGHGYQFIATLVSEEEAATATPDRESLSMLPRALAVAVAIAIVLLGFAWYLLYPLMLLAAYAAVPGAG